MNILLVTRYYHLINLSSDITYSPLGKVFEKQTKTIEDQGEKQIKAIQGNKEQLINNDDYNDNYYFQKKEKSLKISTIKVLIK